jgi:hypothetical protein
MKVALWMDMHTDKLPATSLIPQPNFDQWSKWIDAALFYSHHLHYVNPFSNDFNS